VKWSETGSQRSYGNADPWRPNLTPWQEQRVQMVIYNYIFVGLLLLLGIVFGILPILVEHLIAPRKRSLAKGDTYECGVKTYGETWVRFRIQYYIYALMFVVFDIETVFLFPWAVSYAGLGTFALVEMIVFLAMLVVGLIYAWAKGVLRWV
jgi:NADH-quinone oxidoreductase subunit A